MENHDTKNCWRLDMNNLIKITIDTLKEHPLNARIYGDSAPERALVESIKRNGVLEPIVISRDNTIISGHRRVAACSVVGITEIPARKVDEHSDNLREELIEFNRQRIKTTRQRVNEIRFLRKILGRKQGHRSDLAPTSVNIDASSKRRTDTCSKIAKSIGVSTGTISKLLYIDDFYPELLNWIDDGSVSVHQAYTEAKKAKQGERNKAI